MAEVHLLTRRFGYYLLLAYCDNTGEPLAGLLRPGPAGSNTAADHLAVMDAAIQASMECPRLPLAFSSKIGMYADMRSQLGRRRLCESPLSPIGNCGLPSGHRSVSTRWQT